jgi:hypothetical protein
VKKLCSAGQHQLRVPARLGLGQLQRQARPWPSSRPSHRDDEGLLAAWPGVGGQLCDSVSV